MAQLSISGEGGEAVIKYEEIGKRIYEERKYLYRISHKKMAEDLGMDHAEIRRFEEAESGSGIADTDKLDLIAEYFEIPLERLMFGQKKEIPGYPDDAAKIVNIGRIKDIDQTHMEKLAMVTRADPKESDIMACVCGPYHLYAVYEQEAGIAFKRPQIYCFMADEIIGAAEASVVPAEWFLNEAFLEEICPAANAAHLRRESDRNIVLLQSVYVRDSFRSRGIMRLMIDAAKELADAGIALPQVGVTKR